MSAPTAVLIVAWVVWIICCARWLYTKHVKATKRTHP